MIVYLVANLVIFGCLFIAFLVAATKRPIDGGDILLFVIVAGMIIWIILEYAMQGGWLHA